MEWLSDLGAFFTSSGWKLTVPILGAAGTIIGLGVAIGRWWSKVERKNLEQKVAILEGHVRQLQLDHQSEKATATHLKLELAGKQPEVNALRAQLSEASKRLADAKHQWNRCYQAYVKLKPVYDETKKSLASEKELTAALEAKLGGADQSLVDLHQVLEQRQADLDRTSRRLRRAVRLEGNLWAAKALQKVPKFRPLVERKRAIISVLNLKGGVGKTTVTANLGLELSRRGYRVLLVDLDLQGSLSHMFLDYDKQRALSADKRLLNHFLTAASASHTEKILDYAQELFPFPETGGKLGLVAASDNLAYAELSLTLGWLLRNGERDNRFLLRKALHLLGVNQQYDIVLLDCPPLVNISCINALAASDYLIVPVTFGRRALDRVPVLLKRFLRDERFRKHINHDLKVLGLVANRTYRDGLTGAEGDDWKQLGTWCQDAYGQEVKRFGATIPQLLRDVRETETVTEPPAPNSRLSQVFAALAAEVEQELPHECRRSATALS